MEYQPNNNTDLAESGAKPLETENSVPWEVNADKREVSELGLWRWNMVCFNAHLIQAIICLAVGLSGGNIGKFKLHAITISNSSSRETVFSNKHM